MTVLRADCAHRSSVAPAAVLFRLLVRVLMVLSGPWLVAYEGVDSFVSLGLAAVGITLSVIGAITLGGFIVLFTVLLVRRHPVHCAASQAIRDTSVVRVLGVLLAALAYPF